MRALLDADGKPVVTRPSVDSIVAMGRAPTREQARGAGIAKRSPAVKCPHVQHRKKPRGGTL